MGRCLFQCLVALGGIAVGGPGDCVAAYVVVDICVVEDVYALESAYDVVVGAVGRRGVSSAAVELCGVAGAAVAALIQWPVPWIFDLGGAVGVGVRPWWGSRVG